MRKNLLIETEELAFASNPREKILDELQSFERKVKTCLEQHPYQPRAVVIEKILQHIYSREDQHS